MKKAVLFDLDNTLYDYDKLNKIALKSVYGVINKQINISFKKFLVLFNLSRQEIHRELAGTASAHNRVLYFQRLIEKTHNTVEPAIILKLYDAYWNTFLDNIKLYAGVLPLFRKLQKNNVKIAIVSDLTTNIQLRKLEKLNITSFVDALVTSEEAGSEKPHAIMFLLVLNKLDLAPQDVIMVGDNSVNDIEGANFVRIDTVLLSKNAVKKYSLQDYRRPKYVIKNISELSKILGVK